MERLFFILFVVGIIYLAVWGIKAIIRSATHMPTWEGIIISAILGMLPLYLILCFFGIMGETRNEYPNYSTQSQTYAEEMNKRYANEKPSPKKWIHYAVLVLVVVSLFYIFKGRNSREEEFTTTTETFTTSPNVDIKESNTQMQEEIPTSEKSKQPSSTKNNANERPKTTLELLEEQNHANVVKQAKKAGVSTEGSTLDILDRINHANVVKQAQKAGVSTEGSTLDILDRINHANVVKQAQKAGVSTEGSTLEILERINRKALEE